MARNEQTDDEDMGEILINKRHAVNGNTLVPPFPGEMKQAIFGLGCFWGAEAKFWSQPGVFSTQVGFCGGSTNYPTNAEVNTGNTGHAEVVRVVYYPLTVSYEQLLTVFWTSHDPTQDMRQGENVGSQYRSVIFYTDGYEKQLAEKTKRSFQETLHTRGRGDIKTELKEAGVFYYAEDRHQQYLYKKQSQSCGCT